jgi:hypothetical protein
MVVLNDRSRGEPKLDPCSPQTPAQFGVAVRASLRERTKTIEQIPRDQEVHRWALCQQATGFRRKPLVELHQVRASIEPLVPVAGYGSDHAGFVLSIAVNQGLKPVGSRIGIRVGKDQELAARQANASVASFEG